MITIAVILTFLGFFLFYNTSKKAYLFQSTQLEIWAQGKPQIAQWLGGTLLLTALVLSILVGGFGGGIFTFFILLMTAGSLVVVVAPLRFVNFKVLAAVFAFSLILELI